MAVTADGQVRYSKVGFGMPWSLGEVSITAGRPKGQHTAMPVTSRAVLLSCPDTMTRSEAARASLLAGALTRWSW